MELSPEGLDLIARWEGRRNRPYNDALGHCTVGIGHLLHTGGCTVEELATLYTDDQVDELFRSDVERFVDAVDVAVRVTLSQRQFDALVSFAFNWGVGAGTGFASTSVLALVNTGDFAGAAAELIDGRGPSGRPYDKGLDGVRRRRTAEAEWLRAEEAPAMKFVSRDEWGARPPRSTNPVGAVEGVALHWEGPHMGWPWPHGGSEAGLLAESTEAHERRIERLGGHLATLHGGGAAHEGTGMSALAADAEVAIARAEVWSASCADKVAGIQAFHMDGQGWADIAYNALVCGHGYVFEGRGPDHSNAANGDTVPNRTYLAICDLAGEDDEFTDGSRHAYNDAAEWLGQAQGRWTGHRDHTATACPGGERYDWAHSGHPRPGPAPTPTPPPAPKRPAYAEEEDDVRLVATEDIADQPLVDQAEAEGIEEELSSAHVYRLTWARADTALGAGELQTSLLIRKRHPTEGDTEVLVFWPDSIERATVHAGQTLRWPVSQDGAVAVVSPATVALVVEYDERLAPSG